MVAGESDTWKRALTNNRSKNLAFLSTRPIPPATDEEFAGDLLDFAAELRRSSRGSAPHVTRQTENVSQRIEIPAALEARENQWTDYRLQRRQNQVDFARWSLGFDGVPFPGDTSLAEAFLGWARNPTDCAPGSREFERVREAVQSVSPRINVRSPTWSKEQELQAAWRHALSTVVSESDRVAEWLGCEANEAAHWILAGERPRSLCVKATTTRRLFGPNRVSMTLNPDLVEVDEARSLYRQLKKQATPKAGELKVFLNPIAGNMGGSWSDRLRRWNESHPLRQYKTVASFKTAAWRVTRSDHKSPRD